MLARLYFWFLFPSFRFIRIEKSALVSEKETESEKSWIRKDKWTKVDKFLINNDNTGITNEPHKYLGILLRIWNWECFSSFSILLNFFPFIFEVQWRYSAIVSNQIDWLTQLADTFFSVTRFLFRIFRKWKIMNTHKIWKKRHQRDGKWRVESLNWICSDEAKSKELACFEAFVSRLQMHIWCDNWWMEKRRLKKMWNFMTDRTYGWSVSTEVSKVETLDLILRIKSAHGEIHAIKYSDWCPINYVFRSRQRITVHAMHFFHFYSARRAWILLMVQRRRVNGHHQNTERNIQKKERNTNTLKSNMNAKCMRNTCIWPRRICFDWLPNNNSGNSPQTRISVNFQQETIVASRHKTSRMSFTFYIR